MVPNMHRYARFATVVCIMMLFTFNCTYPMHNKPSCFSFETYHNKTREVNIPGRYANFLDRTKHVASNLQNAIIKFKNSTQDFGKNIYDRVSSELNEKIYILSDEDFRQYEQMMLMKKNPYIDIKEMQFKYSPLNNMRQSLNQDHHSGNEPQLHEPLTGNINVEITNRGLSGFSLPLEQSQHGNSVAEEKAKLTTTTAENEKANREQKTPIKDMLESLKEDIKEYVGKKNL